MEKDGVNKKCRLLLIGGSAGSLEVLIGFLRQLRVAPRFPIVIVIHRASHSDTNLATLLSFKCVSRVTEVEDKETIEAGTVYLAPADYHLLFENENEFALDHSEKVNYSRPSIDVTFESAVQVFGRGAVAILLSGANTDGTAGLAAVKDAGGVIAVQDPSTAAVAIMPEHAVKTLDVEILLHPSKVAEFVSSLQNENV
jgi:two-component system, chemotaxis family, protein-glutamate methylesterase/glutaminase